MAPGVQHALLLRELLLSLCGVEVSDQTNYSGSNSDVDSGKGNGKGTGRGRVGVIYAYDTVSLMRRY